MRRLKKVTFCLQTVYHKCLCFAELLKVYTIANKDSVYARQQETVDELKTFISEEFLNIRNKQIVCQRICRSVQNRLQHCMNCEGSQFKHLL